MTDELFNVCRFFEDGSYEYVCRDVPVQEALLAFRDQCRCMGARTGVIQRVIITDVLDCTNAEWKFGKGLTYPPQPPTTEETLH